MQFCRTYYDIVNEFLPSTKRIAVMQGGTRSGKTYSILQFLIETAIRSHIAGMQGRTITICRKTLPSLKATAMRDFIQILESIGMYSEQMHNKSVGEYHLHESVFEFISLDQPQKVRGRKRDILFINEANELTYEDWRQLLLRTTDRIFLDFNPSDEYHWLYDNVSTRNDANLYITTYKDNPFLNEVQIQEIERLASEDKNYWNIYGLGQRGVSGSTIYTNFEQCERIDANGDTAYGLDFGFNNPTALVKCVRIDSGMYVEQVIYQSHLTNNDLIQLMRDRVPMRASVYCDSAEPDRIAELKRAGFNVHPAKKEVKIGIDKCKSLRLYVHGHELVKEIRNYKWKVDATDKPIDEPVKVNDHLMDAMRYGAYHIIADKRIKSPRTQLI